MCVNYAVDPVALAFFRSVHDIRVDGQLHQGVRLRPRAPACRRLRRQPLLWRLRPCARALRPHGNLAPGLVRPLVPRNRSRPDDRPRPLVKRCYRADMILRASNKPKKILVADREFLARGLKPNLFGDLFHNSMRASWPAFFAGFARLFPDHEPAVRRSVPARRRLHRQCAAGRPSSTSSSFRSRRWRRSAMATCTRRIFTPIDRRPLKSSPAFDAGRLHRPDFRALRPARARGHFRRCAGARPARGTAHADGASRQRPPQRGDGSREPKSGSSYSGRPRGGARAIVRFRQLALKQKRNPIFAFFLDPVSPRRRAKPALRASPATSSRRWRRYFC